MLHPHFLVFVDPFAAYKPEDNPPDTASMLVERLVAAGHEPFVDSRGQPSIEHVKSVSGFAVLHNGDIINCSKYAGEKVLCLQYYIGIDLTDDDILYLISKSAMLYNNYDDHEFPAGDYSHLTLDPVPVNDIVEHSDFLGNTIKMFGDQTFVIDPAPPVNLLKRNVDEVE